MLALELCSALLDISPVILRRNEVRIITNELKSAKLLRKSGFSPRNSEAIMSMISTMEIHNLYSRDEVDIMLSEAVEKVFARQDEKLREQQREFDEKLNLQHRELSSRLTLVQDENRDSRKEFREEMKSSRRWLVGTIITVGMGLAAYISTIIKLSH